MTSTAKSQKDKPHCTTPRLKPRPTAASAARAARNATNRNLNVTTPRKQSPIRSAVSKTKPPQRIAVNIDSKPDIKENEPDAIENVKNCPPEDQFLIPDNIGLPPSPEDPVLSGELVGHLENINENSESEEKKEEIYGIPNQLECQNSGVASKPSSRPNTPAPSSRPETPRSRPISRPQTPQVISRPATPVLSNPHHSTPTSRPNTPQSVSSRPNTPALPTSTPALPTSTPALPTSTPALPTSTPALPTPTPTRNASPHPAVKEDGDIKSVFIMKQRQYNKLKKELDLKQQAVLELFDTLRNLRDQLAREGVSGCGEGNVNELVVFNVADWSTEEVSQLCRDAVASSAIDGAVELINTAVPIDEGALSDLIRKLINVPGRFADLCLQAFTARQELIDWAKELIENNALKDETYSDECLERIARYNAQGLVMCEALRENKNLADEAVDTVTQVSRKACQERSALVVVGEALVREVARLRHEIESQANILHDMKEMRAETDKSKALEDTRRLLESEKASGLALKDKLSTAESQLRQTRIRISKMDRQLREAEASITSLTATVKTLEDQSRQREVQLEARARKLKESLKTGEVTSSQLIQQRDVLQNELTQLKEQMENITTQHKNAIQDLTNQLNDAINAFEEEQKKSQREREAKEAAEAALLESQSNIEELKTKLIELENSKPNPDLPTEREMDLWAELQATKDALRVTEEEVATCKREKVRFLESLTKIAESENKVGMQQKLAAELLSKEESVGKMQIQIRELTKNIKLNEQKVVQYEQYVRELQAHNRAVANCEESPNGISYEDLQQEIMDLKMSLLEAVHRNEELTEILVQKEQQLEQQDKTSRTQARVIKVREELINMLKNKETEQSRELTALQQDLEHRMKVVDEVNKQIAAKAEEIQELFATLENKQQQIHRLEKIVLALEEQQRRAQAQRTRHEEKIAALEHELAASGNRRERKFLFF